MYSLYIQIDIHTYIDTYIIQFNTHIIDKYIYIYIYNTTLCNIYQHPSRRLFEHHAGRRPEAGTQGGGEAAVFSLVISPHIPSHEVHYIELPWLYHVIVISVTMQYI